MFGRDWDTFLLPYEQAVEELKVKFRSMRTEIKRKEEYTPIEFVTGRLKKVSSIIEKAKVLNIPLEQVELVPDIAGLRIMCQFAEDMHRIAEHIRNRKDMTVVEERDYVTNRKPSGYRSYHFIVKYPVQTADGEKELLAEIQLRTLAMNFWATIEHSLNYKYKGNIPEPVKERLVRAAEASYHLDGEMSAIREEIKEAQVLFETKSNTVEEILKNLEKMIREGHIELAADYHQRFHEAQGGDIVKLVELADEIKQTLCGLVDTDRSY
ncbi:GTP pyrophosphokinase family protein [Tumebacillus sp. DT12]|uniref:GTP pyrophosphokinase family protein n=1 Tax=Tumebacillus lacus TaxID=2995335 RepID=A0ABT3X0T6_9BACL|nr:GTP pyrophosphokinase family protein [Tumebacillus lacus]MCX7570056.1 GTP pyrophosphokinase family protein [Tumebacillus lacus]